MTQAHQNQHDGTLEQSAGGRVVAHIALRSLLHPILLAVINFSFRKVVECGVLGGLVFSAVLTSVAAPTVYTIDPTQSELVVQLFKAGAGSVLAHDHVVRATTFTGQMQIDLAALSSGSITVEVQAASLKADEATVRQKYGLSSQLSEKDRQQIQETMLSKSQLDVEHYPVMKFTSTRIEAQTPGTYAINGKLTIRGVTQSVTFPAQVERRDKALHIRGSFRFSQSSFGYEPYSAFFGAVRNQDEVLLHFDVVAVPLRRRKILL